MQPVRCYQIENRHLILSVPAANCTFGQDVQKSAVTCQIVGVRERKPKESTWRTSWQKFGKLLVLPPRLVADHLR